VKFIVTYRHTTVQGDREYFEVFDDRTGVEDFLKKSGSDYVDIRTYKIISEESNTEGDSGAHEGLGVEEEPAEWRKELRETHEKMLFEMGTEAFDKSVEMLKEELKAVEENVELIPDETKKREVLKSLFKIKVLVGLE